MEKVIIKNEEETITLTTVQKLADSYLLSDNSLCSFQKDTLTFKRITNDTTYLFNFRDEFLFIASSDFTSTFPLAMLEVKELANEITISYLLADNLFTLEIIL